MQISTVTNRGGTVSLSPQQQAVADYIASTAMAYGYPATAAAALVTHAAWESNFNPNLSHPDGYDKATGQTIISNGLFQMNRERWAAHEAYAQSLGLSPWSVEGQVAAALGELDGVFKAPDSSDYAKIGAMLKAADTPEAASLAMSKFEGHAKQYTEGRVVDTAAFYNQYGPSLTAYAPSVAAAYAGALPLSPAPNVGQPALPADQTFANSWDFPAYTGPQAWDQPAATNFAGPVEPGDVEGPAGAAPGSPLTGQASFGPISTFASLPARASDFAPTPAAPLSYASEQIQDQFGAMTPAGQAMVQAIPGELARMGGLGYAVPEQPTLTSGYRSAADEISQFGTTYGTHPTGTAGDFRTQGLSLDQQRSMAMAALASGALGVGLYGPNDSLPQHMHTDQTGKYGLTGQNFSLAAPDILDTHRTGVPVQNIGLSIKAANDAGLALGPNAVSPDMVAKRDDFGSIAHAMPKANPGGPIEGEASTDAGAMFGPGIGYGGLGAAPLGNPRTPTPQAWGGPDEFTRGTAFGALAQPPQTVQGGVSLDAFAGMPSTYGGLGAPVLAHPVTPTPATGYAQPFTQPTAPHTPTPASGYADAVTDAFGEQFGAPTITTVSTRPTSVTAQPTAPHTPTPASGYTPDMIQGPPTAPFTQPSFPHTPTPIAGGPDEAQRATAFGALSSTPLSGAFGTDLADMPSGYGGLGAEPLGNPRTPTPATGYAAGSQPAYQSRGTTGAWGFGADAAQGAISGAQSLVGSLAPLGFGLRDAVPAMQRAANTPLDPSQTAGFSLTPLQALEGKGIAALAPQSTIDNAVDNAIKAVAPSPASVLATADALGTKLADARTAAGFGALAAAPAVASVAQAAPSVLASAIPAPSQAPLSQTPVVTQAPAPAPLSSPESVAAAGAPAADVPTLQGVEPDAPQPAPSVPTLQGVEPDAPQISAPPVAGAPASTGIPTAAPALAAKDDMAAGFAKTAGAVAATSPVTSAPVTTTAQTAAPTRAATTTPSAPTAARGVSATTPTPAAAMTAPQPQTHSAGFGSLATPTSSFPWATPAQQPSDAYSTATPFTPTGYGYAPEYAQIAATGGIWGGSSPGISSAFGGFAGFGSLAQAVGQALGTGSSYGGTSIGGSTGANAGQGAVY